GGGKDSQEGAEEVQAGDAAADPSGALPLAPGARAGVGRLRARRLDGRRGGDQTPRRRGGRRGGSTRGSAEGRRGGFAGRPPGRARGPAGGGVKRLLPGPGFFTVLATMAYVAARLAEPGRRALWLDIYLLVVGAIGVFTAVLATRRAFPLDRGSALVAALERE